MVPEPLSPLPLSEHERLVAIYRRWQRARAQRTASAFHGYSRIEDLSVGLASLSLIVLLPIDWAIWRWRSPIPWDVLARPSGTLVAAVVFVVSLTNAALLNSYLARKTPDERAWPLRLRLLRFFLAGLPFVGLYTVAGWRRLREHPKWARLRTDPEPLALQAGGSALFLRWQRWTGRFESFWTLVWLFSSGVGVLALAACWLSAHALGSQPAHRKLIGVSSVLHLLLFAAIHFHFRHTASQRRLSRSRSAALTALSVLWLIPVPGLPIVLGSLLEHRIGGDQERFKSLIFKALIRQKDAGRLPLWLSFEDRLQRAGRHIPWWRALARPPVSMESEPEAGRAEGRIRRLYDLESYSLGFDAAALSWSLAWLAGRMPEWVPALQRLNAVVLGASVLLFLLGSCIVILDVFQRVLRTPGRLRLLVLHPWAGSLARGQLALLSGWVLGWYLSVQGIAQLGTLVALICGLLVILKAMGLMLRRPLFKGRSRRQLPDDVPSLLILFVLAGCGILAPDGVLLTAVLALWALSYPVRARLVGARLVPWLLRPFGWPHLTSPDLPLQMRVLLACLAVPAVLPFGGLAVPAWIFMRHRRWGMAGDVWWQAKAASRKDRWGIPEQESPE